MTETRAIPTDSAIDRIFGPIIQPQTWINILYLLASFPLGVAYFVILTVTLVAGLASAPVFIGLFVLWFALGASDILSEMDRTVVNAMLGAGIPARPPVEPVQGSVFEKMLARVKRPGTLKRLVYLYLRFPMGIVSLVFASTLLPISVVLLTLPLTYTILPVNVGTERVATFDEAIYLCCFGAVFTLLSVHALNSWTAVCRRFAQAMLK